MKQTEVPSGKLVELLRDIAKEITGTDDSGLDEMLIPDKKTRVSNMPEKYHIDFFQEIVRTRGIALSREFIKRDGMLSEAFPWALSEKGHMFWQQVEREIVDNYNKSNGVKPKTSKSKVTDTTPLDVMVKEAEDRGFADGVSTKFGVIKSKRTPESNVLEHELLPNGDFYYHNIKVFKNGKWIKPNVEPKDGNNNSVTIFPKEVESAIHDFISSLGR